MVEPSGRSNSRDSPPKGSAATGAGNTGSTSPDVARSSPVKANTGNRKQRGSGSKTSRSSGSEDLVDAALWQWQGGDADDSGGSAQQNSPLPTPSPLEGSPSAPQRGAATAAAVAAAARAGGAAAPPTTAASAAAAAATGRSNPAGSGFAPAPLPAFAQAAAAAAGGGVANGEEDTDASGSARLGLRHSPESSGAVERAVQQRSEGEVRACRLRLGLLLALAAHGPSATPSELFSAYQRVTGEQQHGTHDHGMIQVMYHQLGQS